jgi:uncharacterized membrane protein
MANASQVNLNLESYLQKLRSALRDLPSGEVEDIVREIRSHVLDRAEGSGQPADTGISSALDALGTPESLASQYVTEHLFSRAEVSRSPWLIQRSIFRWATLSIAGFFVLLASLVGYFLGASLVIAAFAKFVNPHRAGLWMVRLGDHSAGVTLMVLGQANPPAGATDLLGWWYVPIGLVAGVGLLLFTVRFGAWSIRQFRRSHSVLPN